MIQLFGSKKKPKGPNWSRAREHCLDLSGTRICFKTPPNNDRDFPFKKRPTTYNIYNDSLFQATDDSEQPTYMDGGFTENWEFRSLFGSRTSLLFGQIGWVRFGVVVIKVDSGGSLYNVDNFLNAIKQSAYYSQGPKSGHSRFKSIHVRKDWKVQKLDQVQFAHYSHHERAEHNMIDVIEFWATPISKKHYIILRFERYKFTDNSNLDQTYDELIEKVLSTVRIDWSPEALRQQEEARSKWPGQKLPESLPEISWTEEEWRAGENEDQRQQREFSEEIEAIYAKHGKLQA